AGKYRRWSSYIKSTGDEWLPILDLRSRNEVSEFGGKMLELYFYYGRPEYYMGDTDYRLDGSPQDFSYFNYTATDSDGEIRRDIYSDFEAMVRYDIRFISWECAPPIENSFSE
ncbi:MAG: hypothetical protein IIY11_09290, partial [Clostridia bacterium]|nr:hypothetical protein [Clostridia bacterium]